MAIKDPFFPPLSWTLQTRRGRSRTSARTVSTEISGMRGRICHPLYRGARCHQRHQGARRPRIPPARLLRTLSSSLHNGPVDLAVPRSLHRSALPLVPIRPPRLEAERLRGASQGRNHRHRRLSEHRARRPSTGAWRATLPSSLHSCPCALPLHTPPFARSSRVRSPERRSAPLRAQRLSSVWSVTETRGD
ncbi:hypothetical protein BV25DRAFT_1229845 [Artomyces pyxidatus]|uniref:Uncharacterized protein n=1 Tax=Artomyces pyxidatus TaxID=48021 RepID=A0ACB8SRN9_9AGAM|nr:hypothetical protein BV25DRAFT_1229845 [Artomyces pyxidatus]